MEIIRKIKNGLLESENRCVQKIAQAVYGVYDFLFHKSRLSECVKYRPYMEDRKYIERQYRRRFVNKMCLASPQGFNEKNCWRKLYDRQAIYTEMVDKYLVKKVIRDRVGEDYTFPLLGVWERPEDIALDTLPERFVLKANHAGGVIVCRDKNTFDMESAIKELSDTLKIDYACRSREWPYQNVERKIIAEEYMGENLIDYKTYCFNGRMEYVFVWSNESREDGRKPQAYFCGAYDREWNKTEIEIDYPSLNKIVEKPECFEELKRVVEAMSNGIPFVRVDCYIIDQRVYVGEMTFFPWSGYMKFKNPLWNQKLGDLLELPEK